MCTGRGSPTAANRPASTAAVDIRAGLASGRSVVVDRYWLSTVVYHRVMGAPCLPGRIDALYRELGHHPIAGRFHELDVSERPADELVLVATEVLGLA